MIDARPTRSTRIGTILVGLGGAAAVLQSFLAWQQSTLPASWHSDTTYNGGHYPGGVAIAWLGVGVLALWAGWGMRNRFYDAAGWLLILGILIGVLAAVNFVSNVIELASARADVAGTGAILEDTIGLGLYLAVASGPLTAIGALFGVRGHRE